jgi:hypothetical protein
MTSKEKVQEDAAAIRAAFSGNNEVTPEMRQQKILERVRGILALADAEQVSNPAAADNYRQQADVLMTQYAIEQWQVEAAQAGVNKRPEPETRYMDFSWWGTNMFYQNLWSMFHDVARHCRCVIATRGHGKNGSYREIPIIGLPSDLQYFDLLFTHLMLQMGKQLEPKPDPNATFGENAYRLRAAGLARPRIASLLYNMNMIPGTGAGTDYWDETTDERIKYTWLPANKEKSLRAKVRVAGEKWGAANGFDPTTTVNPKVWQRSFALGFVNEINTRLRDMRRLQEDAPGGKADALALRDMYQVALNLYEELWPSPKPPKCKEEGCDKNAYYSGYCEEHCKKHLIKIPRGRAVTRDLKYSGTAINAGRKAGRETSLNAHPSKSVGGSSPSLPKGS